MVNPATDEQNARLIVDLLGAIESRQLDKVVGFYGSDLVFEWQPGLPYAGTHQGTAISKMSETFAAVWGPLQPNPETRRLNPRILACGDGGEVIAQYDWSGLAANGERFTTPTLCEYRVVDNKLRYARMFYFDLAGMLEFLDRYAPTTNSTNGSEPPRS